MDLNTILYQLKNAGKYNVNRKDNRFIITGYGVQGYIDNPYDNPEDFYLFVDCKRLFDKYSKCPIQVKLPLTGEQFVYVLSKMQWLNTEEGYNASKTYSKEQWLNEIN